MNKHNDKKFRELLEKAIGTETKQGFAERARIAPQQLSRYLREDYKATPSQKTLRKIADAAGDNELYDELLQACGYGESPSMARRSKPFEERALLNAQDLKSGLKELTEGTVSYPSIEALIRAYEPIFSFEKLTEIRVFGKREYEGRRNLHAEYIACVKVKFETRVEECLTWMAVYFAETKGGNVVIFDIAMDPASVLEANGISKEVYEQIKDSEYVYQIRASKAVANADTKEALFEAIFGDFGEEYVCSYLGFGFYLDDMKDPASFIKRHREAFCTGATENALYNRLANGEGAEIFADYEAEEYPEYRGIEGAIAKIMREETDLMFSSCMAGDNEIEANRPCIMLEDAIDAWGGISDNYNIEDLKEICEAYARELGITEYGEVHMYGKRFENKRNIFTVD